MPHMITNRPRKYGLKAVDPDKLEVHFTLESINAACYAIGGVVFVIGSVFFLPKYGDYIDWGSYMFIVGSVLYIAVSGHDCMEIFFGYEQASWLDKCAAVIYTVGAIIYILGSVWFLPDVGKYTQGAWCLIAGSCLFIVGAAVNAMQIFETTVKWTQEYLNLVAICYVTGSTMFLCASVPYLFDYENPNDEETVYQEVAVQFIVGSIFFVLGGIINARRAKLVMNDDLKKREEKHTDVTELPKD